MIGRLFLLGLLSLGLAPGTWLRTPVALGLDRPVSLREVHEPGAPPPAGWSLEGIWEYSGEGLLFGGYSALLALPDGRLEAFSDRRGRCTFLQPDAPQGPDPSAQRVLADQAVDPAYQTDLHDIDAATRDPETGQYWLAFEGFHSFQRYGPAHSPQGVRVIDEEVEWSGNAGAEAFVRLRDGRFLAVSEWGEEALLYPGDPVSDAAPVSLAFGPALGPEGRDFSVTDAVQLPDGRIMMLLRRVVWGIPPFEARVAITDWPVSAEDADEAPVLAPRIVLNLTAVAPPENYEGLAVRARADGALDIWVIADDNLSAMQRTLVLKLRFDPASEGRDHSERPETESKAQKQKARE